MVSNDRRTKLLPKIIAGQLFALLAISAIAGSMIFFTHGYRINLKNLKVEKTGLISIDYSPSDAELYINQEKVSARNTYAKNVWPGTYSVEIKMKGFTTWEKDLFVAAESVNAFKNIILFKESPVVSELTDNNKIAILNNPVDILASNARDRLYYNSHEIWAGDKLVTRLSDPILKAVWYPDLFHIIYQQGNQIRVIEVTGTNDSLLVRLNQDTPTHFAVGNRGEELYFIDQDKYLVATIR